MTDMANLPSHFRDEAEMARPRPGLGAIAGRLALVGYVGAILAWLIFPVALVVIASFQGSLEASLRLDKWSLDAYAAIPRQYWESLWFTAQTSFWATVSALAITIPAAWGLIRGRLRERRLVGNLVLLPDAIPSITLGMALLTLFIPLGLSNSLGGTLIALVAVSLPMGLRFTEALLEGIPEDYENAAVTMGANRFVAFVTVTLPLAAPGLAIATLFIFVHNLVTFELLLFISGPHANPISVRLFIDIVERGVLPHAVAMAAILVYIAIAFYMAVAMTIGVKYLSRNTISRKG